MGCSQMDAGEIVFTAREICFVREKPQTRKEQGSAL